MFGPYVRVTASAWVAAALLLTGAGIAGATPDSGDNKGGGKPSPAASGKTNGNSPGNSQGTKPANPGKPDTTPTGNATGKPTTKPGASGNSAGNSAGDPKTLPDTASPVAQAAVNKDTTAKSPPTVPPAEEVAEPVTPAPHDPATNTETPSAASPQGNGDHVADGPASHARPVTSLTPSAPRVPADGTESLGAPATAALTAPRSPGNAAPDVGGGAAADVGRWLGDVATTIGRQVRDAIREVTLKDLALAALPGIAGLLFFLVTGVGLGHRQARFSFAIQTAGGLRLSPGGPLGVVGADSFVHVNARAAKPRNRALRPVDRAA